MFSASSVTTQTATSTFLDYVISGSIAMEVSPWVCSRSCLFTTFPTNLSINFQSFFVLIQQLSMLKCKTVKWGSVLPSHFYIWRYILYIHIYYVNIYYIYIHTIYIYILYIIYTTYIHYIYTLYTLCIYTIYNI